MTAPNWLITGVSSGFGREVAIQLLDVTDPGAAELSDEQVSHIIATNLTGSIQLILAALPRLARPGDPARMAVAIIASADQQPPRCASSSDHRRSTRCQSLRDRIAGFEAQAAWPPRPTSRPASRRNPAKRKLPR